MKDDLIIVDKISMHRKELEALETRLHAYSQEIDRMYARQETQARRIRSHVVINIILAAMLVAVVVNG
jgi:hypothetical protein